MLHAPTSETKTDTSQGKAQVASKPEQEVYPHMFGAVNSHTLKGAMPNSSPDLQRRLAIAGLQSTYGNQAVLHALRNPSVARTPSIRPSQSLILQRTCACGGSSESAGECVECKARHEATLQRSVSNQVAPSAAITVHDVPHSSSQSLDTAVQSGKELPEPLRRGMEHLLGENFASVQIHQNSNIGGTGKLAVTEGQDIYFAPERYQPGTQPGQRLIAHELAHVAQQRHSHNATSQFTRNTDGNRPLEMEAEQAANAVIHGSRFVLTGATPVVAQFSQLSQLVEQAVTKDEAFNHLRAYGPARNDTDLTKAIQTRFGSQPDDLWLASTLQTWGSEPLWPIDAVNERVKRAHTNRWFPEAGNIEATLADPDPDPGQNLPPVHAYFFPGRTERRALIIGGVHGNEPSGAEVVERLRTLLTTKSLAGQPPYFTTILVPVAIPRTYSGTNPPQPLSGERYVPGVSLVKGKVVHRPIEPNRNFPLPGESYAQARARGAASPNDPELEYFDPATGKLRPPQDRPGKGPGTEPVTSIRMLPETRILIRLLERFQPERLASVHAHSLKIEPGDAPGIFVDPRGLDPRTSKPDPALKAQTAEDDALALSMVTEGRRRIVSNPLPQRTNKKQTSAFDPFTGNRLPGGGTTVRYSSTEHVEGSSLGTYAPVPVAGVRSGITTLTIEVPKYQPDASAALNRVEDLDRDLLYEIFLGDPTAATQPSPVPTSPAHP